MASSSSLTVTSLASARYIALTTFRKNGQSVMTPVWFTEANGTLYVFTSAGTGKVKRVRHTAHVTVAPCTFSGTVTGTALDAAARLVGDPAEQREARQAIMRKYWIQGRAMFGYNRLQRTITRKPDTTTYLAIATTPQ